MTARTRRLPPALALLLVAGLAGCGDPYPYGGDPYVVSAGAAGFPDRAVAPDAEARAAAQLKASVTVAPGHLTLGLNGRGKLMPTVKRADGQLDQNVQWSSSDETVATVNPTTGEVTALREGWVTVVAAYGLDPRARAIVPVHVVPAIETKEAAQGGVALAYPGHWTLRAVESDNRDTKTLLSLTKAGPAGASAWLDVFVADVGYYARLGEALSDRGLTVGPIVAGNKDGVGSVWEAPQDGKPARNTTWVVNANGYAYTVQARVLTTGDAAPEADAELSAILASLKFSAPAARLDLVPPPTLVDQAKAAIDKALGLGPRPAPTAAPATPAPTPTPAPGATPGAPDLDLPPAGAERAYEDGTAAGATFTPTRSGELTALRLFGHGGDLVLSLHRTDASGLPAPGAPLLGVYTGGALTGRADGDLIPLGTAPVRVTAGTTYAWSLKGTGLRLGTRGGSEASRAIAQDALGVWRFDDGGLGFQAFVGG